MLTLASLIFFFATSETVASHKPPLQFINHNILPLEQLDITLKARHWTKVDALNEALEGVKLTQRQQQQLKAFNERQNQIIDGYKIFYQLLIEEQKKAEFNRSQIINETIADYRKTVQDVINEELSGPIVAFCQRIKMSSSAQLRIAQNENTIPDKSRRRQRSED